MWSMKIKGDSSQEIVTIDFIRIMNFKILFGKAAYLKNMKRRSNLTNIERTMKDVHITEIDWNLGKLTLLDKMTLYVEMLLTKLTKMNHQESIKMISGFTNMEKWWDVFTLSGQIYAVRNGYMLDINDCFCTVVVYCLLLCYLTNLKQNNNFPTIFFSEWREWNKLYWEGKENDVIKMKVECGYVACGVDEAAVEWRRE